MCIERIGKVDETLAMIGFAIDYSQQAKVSTRCSLLWIILNVVLDLSEVMGMTVVFKIKVFFMLTMINQTLHINTLIFMIFGNYIR